MERRQFTREFIVVNALAACYIACQQSPQAFLLEKLKLQSNIAGRSPCAPVSQAYVKSG